MAFEMVDAQRRNAQSKGERIGHAGADQQRPGQPRPLGIGKGIEVIEPGTSLAHYLADQRQHAPDVVTRSQFGHHAAILLVHRNLCMQGVREQAALTVIQRDAGFVAGGFYAQDQHGAGVNALVFTIWGKLRVAARYDTRLQTTSQPGPPRAWLSRTTPAPG